METNEARHGTVVRVGTVVWVREDLSRPECVGMRGVVEESFGSPDYAALEVLLEDGRRELFWYYQLEGAQQN